MARTASDRLGRALAALALTLLMACAGSEPPRADPPALFDIESAPSAIQAAAEAVVRIQHPAGGAGTGAFISDGGLLLTNNHVLGSGRCAREGCSITLTFQHQRGTLSLPPRTLFAVPQHVSAGLDMAVVQVFLDETRSKPLSTPHFLTFESRTAEELVGRHVTVVGHPLGRLKKWSSGFVLDADGEWFESTVFSLPGNSGSPVLNDEGQLVGLLHRGAEGFDLLTATSSQVSTIATAAAALQPALGAPLPASIFSVADPLTREAALAQRDAFLAASTWRANIDGESVRLLELLATACDQSLGRQDYESLEELQEALAYCFSALSFIECRSDVGESNQTKPRECPESERAAWRARMQLAAFKQLQFNGSLDLSAISFSVEALASTQLEGEQLARSNILTALDASKLPLDFSVASYLAAYGVESYDGVSTRDWLLDYARVPFYERHAWDIAISALWLYAADLLERAEALKIARELYRNDKVSLGAKLRIEEVLYTSDEL
ncbi:MAG: V8-like Glu-specific endopeptidase [Myxococcaceae bacterium]|nr:V8-like Glu-specific endopeptidase [Myxococcaceae bacterium]